MLDGVEHSVEFDRYLSGDMSPEERATFEQSIRQDASLREAFRLHARTTAGLQQAAHAARKAELLEDLKTHPPVDADRGQVRRFMPMLLTAAAIVIVLLSVSLYLGLTAEKQPWQMTYLQQVPSFPTERGEIDKYQTIRDALHHKEWQEATSLIHTTLEEVNESEKADLWFFLGISQVKGKEELAQASKALEQVPATSIYYEDAHWWMALAAAQMGEKEKVRSLLTDISQADDHLYQEEAQAVLARLRE